MSRMPYRKPLPENPPQAGFASRHTNFGGYDNGAITPLPLDPANGYKTLDVSRKLLV